MLKRPPRRLQNRSIGDSASKRQGVLGACKQALVHEGTEPCSARSVPKKLKRGSANWVLLSGKYPWVAPACADCPGFLVLVLLLPRLPRWSRSLRMFPWPSISLYGPLDICLDLLPAAPPPPMQKRDPQHKLLQHRGARTDFNCAKTWCTFLAEIITKHPKDPAVLKIVRVVNSLRVVFLVRQGDLLSRRTLCGHQFPGNYRHFPSRALRGILMPRKAKIDSPVSHGNFLTRNYPHPNCLSKCLTNCLSPTREGNFSSFKIAPAVRVIARQLSGKNCLAAFFASRHEDASPGPLGKHDVPF